MPSRSTLSILAATAVSKPCRQAARKCSGQDMTPASSSRSTGLKCCPIPPPRTISLGLHPAAATKHIARRVDEQKGPKRETRIALRSAGHFQKGDATQLVPVFEPSPKGGRRRTVDDCAALNGITTTDSHTSPKQSLKHRQPRVVSFVSDQSMTPSRTARHVKVVLV